MLHALSALPDLDLYVGIIEEESVRYTCWVVIAFLFYLKTDPLPHASSALPAGGRWQPSSIYWQHRRRIFKRHELGRHCLLFYLQTDPLPHVSSALPAGGRWQPSSKFLAS